MTAKKPQPDTPANILTKRLTRRQKAFIREYLVDFNATAAAERAGYRGSPEALRVTGSRNLRTKHIGQAIQAQVEEWAIFTKEIGLRLTRQARGSMASFLSLDPDGYLTLDLNKALASGDLDLIERIKFNQWTLQDGTVRNQVELKLYSAQRALTLLGKAAKMWQGLNWVNPQEEQESSLVLFHTRRMIEEMEKRHEEEIQELHRKYQAERCDSSKE